MLTYVFACGILVLGGKDYHTKGEKRDKVMFGMKDCWNPTIEELEKLCYSKWIVVIEAGVVVGYEWEVE